MGMLSGFVKGLAGGVADVAERRSKELRDDELIAKREQMELAREQRITEAAEKNHIRDRKELLGDYDMKRTDNLSDYGRELTDKRTDAATAFDNSKTLNAEIRTENRTEAERLRNIENDDPSSLKNQLRTQQIESQALKNEELRQKQRDADVKRLQNLDDKLDFWNNGKEKISDFAPGDYEKQLAVMQSVRKEADSLRKSLEMGADAGSEGTGMIPKGGKPSDDAVIAQVLKVESNGDDSAVSNKGARHAMQVMPETAKNPGFSIEGIKNDSPEEYNRVGREYIVAMRKQYGDDDKAFAAYNAGPEAVNIAVSKAIKTGKNWKEFLPQETKDYIRKMNAGLGKEQPDTAKQEPKRITVDAQDFKKYL